MRPIDSTILAACIQAVNVQHLHNAENDRELSAHSFALYDAIMAESNRREGKE